MQNNASDRHEIRAYPVTRLCKARKNQRDYYMGQKTLAHILRRNFRSNRGEWNILLFAVTANPIPFSSGAPRKNNNTGQ